MKETPSGTPAEAPKPAEEVLRIEGAAKSFGTTLVLDGLSLVVRSGENLAVLGRSGIGKSVLLKVITGLVELDRGNVFLWQRNTQGLSESERTALARRMGMVFQSGALFDSMNVRENVAFPLRERKMRDEVAIGRVVEERLEWVGLPGTGHLLPSQLSGGMRRRVALARTLAGGPEFVLYDEPTAGLDPVTGRKIARLMRDLDRKLRSTSILVTHDIECARLVSSRWAFLSGGRIVADGPPEALEACAIPEVREFLSREPEARDLPAVPVEP